MASPKFILLVSAPDGGIQEELRGEGYDQLLVVPVSTGTASCSTLLISRRSGGAPGDTAYLILIGLNIEIAFMFAIAGVAFGKMLPPDKKLKIFGIPNRLVIAVGGAAFCVFVEVLLNLIGALTWDYPWWSAGAPWLIFLFGYLHFLPGLLLGA